MYIYFFELIRFDISCDIRYPTNGNRSKANNPGEKPHVIFINKTMC